jgi:ParB-like chromosome segregation protein Spo0J
MDNEQTQAVKEHRLVDIPIKDISLDADNPNVMSREQMHGLRLAMEKWGYLVPIIVDRNNVVVDGQHRLLVYREMGMGRIPAYRLDLDSAVDAKELRQVMNKLKGTHELSRDLAELEFIAKQGDLAELAALIGQDVDALQKMISASAEAGGIIGEANELAERMRLGMKCPQCGFEW